MKVLFSAWKRRLFAGVFTRQRLVCTRGMTSSSLHLVQTEAQRVVIMYVTGVSACVALFEWHRRRNVCKLSPACLGGGGGSVFAAGRKAGAGWV
jgi:hypothetical protein